MKTKKHEVKPLGLRGFPPLMQDAQAEHSSSSTR